MENLEEYAKSKLISKNADLVVANDVTKVGAGFNTDTNDVMIIDRAGNKTCSGIKTKDEIAELILDKMIEL